MKKKREQSNTPAVSGLSIIQAKYAKAKEIIDDTGPDGKKHIWWPLYITIVVVFLIATIFGLKMSYYSGANPKAPMALVIWNFFMTKTSIFPLFGRAANWFYLKVCYFAAFFICLATWADIERNKQSMPGKEKGSMHWNTWKEYNMKYTYPPNSPKIEEPPEGSEDIGNMIISKKTYMNMDTHVTKKANNMLINGTTGSGKTRFWLKPNILQFNASFVVTDPSGELLADCGQALINHGYRIKVFNIAEFKYSCMYNPFHYIRNDEGVMVLVKCLMQNTDDSKASKGDQFFTKAEECLFMSLFYYIYYEYKNQPERQNMDEVMNMLRMAKVSEKNEDIKSALDIKFDELEKKDPNHIAVKNYKIFRMGTGKTLKSILISAGVRMAPFNIKAIRNLTQTDTIHLEELGDRKQALFIITKAEDHTFNFLAAMMYTQLFETEYYVAGTANKYSWHMKKGTCTALKSGQFHNSKQKEEQRKWLEGEVERYRRAVIEKDDPKDKMFQEEDEDGLIPWPKIRLVDKDTHEILQEFYSEAESDMFMDCIRNGKIVPGKKRLSIHLRCLLDEFANIGEIPGFLLKLSTMRKYEISCCIVVQNTGQLKAMYKDDYTTLIGNCTVQLFLGSAEKEDTEYYSEMTGDETITVKNTSLDAKHHGIASSASYNKDSARLIRPEEIRKMPSDECLVIINNEEPFRDKKYPLEMHPNYNELADADPANSLEYQRLFFVPDCDAEREKRGRFQSFIHSISKTKPANSSYFKPVEDMRDKIIQNALESDDKDMKQAVPVDRSRLADSKPVTEAFADMASAHGYEQTAKGFRDNENVMINEALDILQADEKKKITKKIQDGTLNFTPDGGVLMEDDPMTRMLSGY